jgi:dienelactone hydrolase
LKTNGFNLARVFSGTYREAHGTFNIIGNTLAPANDRFVCPWARSESPGAIDGGTKFDLSKWDPAYFQRLRELLRAAGERGVVVELVLFCTMYDDTLWNISPMNSRNNVNGVGNVARNAVYSGKDQGLIEVQKAVVTKLVTELNSFDNLYFEICNELYDPGRGTGNWSDQMIAAIVNAESVLPNKHLIAEAFPPSADPVPEFNRHVSIMNFHAAQTESVRLNYSLNRVLAHDETGGGDRSDRKYRTEGWDWMMAGGGVYDHLDFSFTTDRSDGSAVPLPDNTPGGGGPELRRQLGILKRFVESLPFTRMKPDEDTVKNSRIAGAEAGARPGSSKPLVRALSEPGQAYAIYINGGTQATLVLQLPPGTYQADWIDTRTGLTNKTETFHHRRGNRTLASPDYAEDIALRVVRPPPQAAALAQPPPQIEQSFHPPEKYRSDFGDFRSPLVFADGTRVKTGDDWTRRREEIRSIWHKLMGPWPALIERPRVEVVNTTRRENITQQQLRIEIGVGNEMVDALLLLPEPSAAPQRRPAVLVTYYDAETGAGLGAPWRDFGWQLAKRGFITLSVGKPNAAIDLTTTNKPRTEPYIGPAGKPVRTQPLSALAYAAANAHTVMAQRADVDPDRIGIVGHSFGGKWAMFASCLYDKFACAVWSDPGIVFDERDRRKENPSGSVNYWDVWYLGFELGAIADPKNAGPFRNLPSEGQPRTGAYKALVEGGHDLLELHALMAPRPFLVSGGTADLPERWPALNHAVAVNQLLGVDHRVALTARDGHTPTEQSNEEVYRFFEWCLQEVSHREL